MSNPDGRDRDTKSEGGTFPEDPSIHTNEGLTERIPQMEERVKNGAPIIETTGVAPVPFQIQNSIGVAQRVEPSVSVTSVGLPSLASNQNATNIKSQSSKKQNRRKLDGKPESGRKRRKKTKDPSAPKNPLSAYLFFVVKQRSDMSASDSELSFSAMAKKIGKKWKAMSKEGKVPYLQLAEYDKTRYEKEKKQYKQKQDGMGVLNADQNNPGLQTYPSVGVALNHQQYAAYPGSYAHLAAQPYMPSTGHYQFHSMPSQYPYHPSFAHSSHAAQHSFQQVHVNVAPTVLRTESNVQVTSHGENQDQTTQPASVGQTQGIPNTGQELVLQASNLADPNVQQPQPQIGQSYHSDIGRNSQTTGGSDPEYLQSPQQPEIQYGAQHIV